MTALPASCPVPRAAQLRRMRVALADGAATTVHLASFPLEGLRVRVLVLDGGEPLARHCARTGIAHAVVGGFFTRPGTTPLGELRIGGRGSPHVAFTAPWHAVRGCLSVANGVPRLAPRDELPSDPPGDLLQAGPLLVRDGAVVAVGEDGEGFAAASEQFDSDITAGRHPRAAIALSSTHLLALVCDGRSERDAGLALGELAELLVGLGAREALNLDGGGSASLVFDGRLRNHPREAAGIEILGGRSLATAIALEWVP